MRGPELPTIENRFRFPARLLHPHAPLALSRREFVQGPTHRSFGVTPAAADEDQIALIESTVSELFGQFDECGHVLGAEQHPRRVPVQAMHQLEQSRIRARGAKLLDET